MTGSGRGSTVLHQLRVGKQSPRRAPRQPHRAGRPHVGEGRPALHQGLPRSERHLVLARRRADGQGQCKVTLPHRASHRVSYIGSCAHVKATRPMIRNNCGGLCDFIVVADRFI